MTIDATLGSPGPRREQEASVVTAVLGNASDPVWAARLEGAEVDLLELDQWAAQRSRLRRSTSSGRDLAVSLARDARLHDGDILVWDETGRKAVVARVDLEEVMVLDLAPVLERPPERAGRDCFELGHAIGNQHWPAVVRGTRVYIPVTINRTVMASVMKTHAFDGIRPRFTAGDEILPYLAPHEARRLFGGADQGVHSHASDDPEDGEHTSASQPRGADHGEHRHDHGAGHQPKRAVPYRTTTAPGSGV